jgi:anthranilate synthase/aminodeoxychorismate synthase-like glutamine amidotransferase
VKARIAVVDNYDSFVYNLVQYLGELGAEPLVVRNDEVGVADLHRLGPDALLVSPGPGRPESAGVSNEAIVSFGRAGVPVLGVCLGHQCIGAVFGGDIVRAPEVVHGRSSPIHHDGLGVFTGLPNPFVATRYHSLVVGASSVPEVLEVTAHSPDGLVMGLRHRTLPIEGVQFHPESILTGETGKALMRNFVGQASAAATFSSASPPHSPRSPVTT